MGLEEVLLVAVVALAVTVQTITGFGGNVIALSLGVHLFPIERLVMAMVLVGLVQNVTIAFREREHTDRWLLLRTILPWAGAGLLGGAVLRPHLAGEELRIILGVFVIAIAAWELLLLARGVLEGRPLPRPVGWAFLGVGGLVHGLLATGGPLIVYFVSRVVDDKHRFRATLTTMWIFLNLGLLASGVVADQVDREVARLAALLLPSLLIGLFVGDRLHHRVPLRTFRVAVNLLLLAAGVAVLV